MEEYTIVRTFLVLFLFVSAAAAASPLVGHRVDADAHADASGSESSLDSLLASLCCDYRKQYWSLAPSCSQCNTRSVSIRPDLHLQMRLL